MGQLPPLPLEQVEYIFSVMACLYGRRFSEMWEGQRPEVVKRFWAHKLAGFSDYPQAITAALESLDERTLPPTLPEFLALCRTALRRIGTMRVMLEVKPIPRERAAQILAEAKARLKAQHKATAEARDAAD